MNGRNDIGPARRRAVARARGGMHPLRWLLVVPFLLLSLVSQGTMLAQDAQGGVTVVLCSGDGLVEMVLDPDGGLRDKAPGSAHQPCDWSLHAQAAMAHADAALRVPPEPPILQNFRPAPPDHLRRAEILAPSARGPPSIV